MGAWLLLATHAPAESPPKERSFGEVKIQGDAIVSLQLLGTEFTSRQFARPDKVLRLPAGRYRVQQVKLDGGYTSNARYPRPDDGWFEVTPENPYELAVGAPLSPTVTARREGQYLNMKYSLVDAGGREYAKTDGVPQLRVPPRFTVYMDDQEIGSGSFKYG
jgi:hypothetical protein